MANVGTIKAVRVPELYSPNSDVLFSSHPHMNAYLKILYDDTWTASGNLYYHEYNISSAVIGQSTDGSYSATTHFLVAPYETYNDARDEVYSTIVRVDTTYDYTIIVYRTSNSTGTPASSSSSDQMLRVSIVQGGEDTHLTDTSTGNTYNLGLNYLTFTGPTGLTGITETDGGVATGKYHTYISKDMTGCSDLYGFDYITRVYNDGGNRPIFDPLITTVATKASIEEAGSHIIDIEVAWFSDVSKVAVKFTSDTNAMTGLEGVTIQVSGF